MTFCRHGCIRINVLNGVRLRFGPNSCHQTSRLVWSVCVMALYKQRFRRLLTQIFSSRSPVPAILRTLKKQVVCGKRQFQRRFVKHLLRKFIIILAFVAHLSVLTC